LTAGYIASVRHDRAAGDVAVRVSQPRDIAPSYACANSNPNNIDFDLAVV